MKKFGIVALCAAMLGGCLSVDHAVVPKTGEEHVLVRHRGYMLFNCIPLGSRVTMTELQEEFEKYAAQKNRRSGDFAYHSYDSVFFRLPFISIPLPYVLCTHELQLSGVLK